MQSCALLAKINATEHPNSYFWDNMHSSELEMTWLD